MDRESQKAVFLDRDGTLIEEVDFLSRVEDLRLFPYTKQALELLKKNGFQLFVITNQSGIGRGLYSEMDMNAIHEQMQIELDGMIDAFYFCPHLPDDGCDCRKPKLKMINEAQNSFGVDISNSWVIGDKLLDAETARAAGMNAAMVRTGYGKAHEALLEFEPELIEDDLLAAAIAITNRK